MAPLAGLNYKRCRVEELKVFVEKRSGKKPPKSSKKQRLIDTLQELDEEPGVFRFLDLPAEMRNLIYGHVLALHQTRDEAQGILYGNNIPQVAIKIAHRPGRTFLLPGPQLREYSFLGVHLPTTAFESPRRISGTYSNWPAHLLRFHHVEVNVVVDAQHSTTAVDAPKHLRIALNHCLYSICTFLASSRALKGVKINLVLENSELPEETELQQTLWPITRLGELAQLNLEGMPEEVGRYIQDHRKKPSTTPPVDVFRKACRLRTKIMDLKNLVDDVKQRVQKDRVITRGYEIQEALRSVNYVDEQLDEELRKQVGKLEELFADPVVVVQIKARADAYIARMQETRDGAFEEA